MDNLAEILEKAIEKLTEMYGENFTMEEDDEFVFSLNDGTLILSKEDEELNIKFLLDKVIPLDMNLKNDRKE